ncbi:MAG: iron-sulfur cluster co-chaperone HscB C-terminal domain-containing protein [Planctomycetota bacterium]
MADAGDLSMEDAPSDPFAILGIPRAFQLSRDAVEAAYLVRASKLHPDLASGDASATAAAAQQMAELNAARSTLLNNEMRANVLAALAGVPPATACRDLPDGFLMDMMQTRLELEEAVQSEDAPEIDRWHAWATERRGEYAARFASLLAGVDGQADSDGDAPDADAARSVREHLNAWRYIERLAAQLRSRGALR